MMMKTYLCLIILFLISCTRSASIKNQFKIEFPKTEKKSIQNSINNKNKITQLSNTLNYENLCFGVNVKSPNSSKIDADTCQVEQGVFLGTVEPGNAIEVVINLTNKIDFEVYGFLRSNTNEPCPVLNAGRWNWPLEKTYLLAKELDFKITDSTTVIEAKLNIPDMSQNLIAINQWPISCQTATPIKQKGINRFSFVANAKSSQGQRFKVYSRIKYSNDMKTLTGSQFQIKNWH